MFILRLINKNISWKNQALPSLFSIQYLRKNILNILKIEPLIFCNSMLIKRAFNPNFKAYFRVIELIPLPELIRAWILFFLNKSK